MYSAHWDHLGIGLPDAKGDRIYNGAHDNALGVAGIMEVARIFASQPPSQRSVVFLFVTAEEKGLLGSEYYANHPVFPLATTAAIYNLDGGSTVGLSHDVTVRGDGKISLQDDLATAAVKTGRHLSPDVRPEAGSFYRSDHFSFAKAGVPAISFQPGEDLVDGGPAGGKAANADYNTNRYHQPADEWSDTWDLRGMVQDMQLLYTMGREMANSRTWPKWAAGSEFKAIRETTDKSRQ
jgi:Zn-dependent M28 family amino/carboxypeptidase